MPGPFPGMDPYIERDAIWGDFQASFVVLISAALNPSLKPSYVAMVDSRTFEIELPRCSWRGEVRETFIKIVRPQEVEKPLAAVAVVSPSNKAAGPGRASYLRMQEAFAADGVELTEIDLLRGGERMVRCDMPRPHADLRFDYLVSISRPREGWRELYPAKLRERLPTIPVRFNRDGARLPLDLQQVMDRCWDGGPYPELLHYESKPPGKLSPEDVAWCEQLLVEKGFR
jgi:hypothetical protein